MDIMKDIKVIFIDIDGTLTNSKKIITQKTKEVIKKVKEKGVIIVLCSGRPNSYTVEKSVIASASPITISNSGNLVYDYENNKVISINEINKKHLIEMYNYCEKNKMGCTFNGIMKCYQNQYSFRNYITIKFLEEIDEPISQMCVSAYTLKDALEFQKYINESGNFSTGYISKSVLDREENAKAYNFDVINQNMGKGYGISNLLKYLNISKSKTMCFGDYINDYSMFKECGISVAMGNSTKKLKGLADFTTLTNDNDGVAVFLEDNLL